MPSKKLQADPSTPVVLRRYRAAGEARELGIASVPHGGIVVEALDDGSFRLAPDQEAPLFEPAPVAEPLAEPVADATPEPASAPDAAPPTSDEPAAEPAPAEPSVGAPQEAE